MNKTNGHLPEEILRTDSENPEFRELVRLLDAELAIRDGKDHAFYHQFNGIADLKNVILCRLGSAAVGCGAFKQIDSTTVEVKRMYVLPEARNQGRAKTILTALESWAKEMGYHRLRLETGINQPEAIHLYERSGYSSIENYGPYAGVRTSRCYQKVLQ